MNLKPATEIYAIIAQWGSVPISQIREHSRKLLKIYKTHEFSRKNF